MTTPEMLVAIRETNARMNRTIPTALIFFEVKTMIIAITETIIDIIKEYAVISPNVSGSTSAVPEKTEVILQGGTFPFSPYTYQEYFVKYLLKAMNDFSRLFYDDGINMDKFNKFFEMPADISDKNRTKRIQKKLMFIKNLDLNNEKILDTINNLFFDNKIKNNNEIIEQWGKYRNRKWTTGAFIRIL